MTEYYSEIKTIPYTDKDIFLALSDLRNLEQVKDKLPQDKMKDFYCEHDFCSVSVDPIGKVKFVITDRQPNSLIKFEAEQVPFGVSLFIVLAQVSKYETTLKVTVNADLNMFLKPMVSKPLQQAVDKMAEMLATIPYDKIEKNNL